MMDETSERDLDDDALVREWAELDMALRGAAVAGAELPDAVGLRVRALREEIERRGIDLFRRLPDPLGVVSAIDRVRRK